MKETGVLCHISSLPAKYGIGSLGKEAYKFANPEHRRCGGCDYEPVGKPERHYVEEVASECHDQYLAAENQECDEPETSASLEMEGGAPGGKGPGVEHVPELEEYENSEE